MRRFRHSVPSSAGLSQGLHRPVPAAGRRPAVHRISRVPTPFHGLAVGALPKLSSGRLVAGPVGTGEERLMSGIVERLRELSGPQLYRHNAFRVTGMATDAGHREISRRKQQVTMALRAGVAVESRGEPPVPGQSGAEDYERAFAVLDHPQRRIVDEVFWLWGDTAEAACPCSAALHSEHDAAVQAHARALDAELQAARGPQGRAGADHAEHWKTAAHTWQRLLARRDAWTHLRYRVAALDDKQLSESAVAVLGAHAPRTLVSSVAALAVHTQHPGRLAEFCSEWTWAGEHLLAELLEEQMRPLYESAGDSLQRAGERLHGDSQDSQDSQNGRPSKHSRAGGRISPSAAREAARTLSEEVVPVVRRLRAFAEHAMSLQTGQLADSTALLLNNCALAISPEWEKLPAAPRSFELLDLALSLQPAA